ncbi:MAG: fumarylacetoacetate hydrolase family protein [Clostridia bacterium]|jgi:2-keto-4-pentenoate hydratase/2-oxohepta-3-ene-1,7-dioic acid hydratase in catechol pathway|nr:fumarylacetoacetate hydrolase family protein [Clostridia bacterium]
MKLVNFMLEGKVRLGIKTDQGIINVKTVAAPYSGDVPITIEEVIARGEQGIRQLEGLMKEGVEAITEDKIVYAPCITNPEKILCVGLNYREHARETKAEIPEWPILFSKFNNALAAHKQVISLPKTAEKFDYEAELVIVIGKEASNVSKEDAPSYVFGYTCGNDLSARDLQLRSGQWLLGKTCDGFAPVGPYIVTADEIDPNNLEICCEVNGSIRQSSNTGDMIFDCATIVSYASQYMTLKPGDLIFTGTPSGVILGYPKDKRQWLKPGDEVRVTIEKIGTLINTMG